jgi:hypothetical protein
MNERTRPTTPYPNFILNIVRKKKFFMSEQKENKSNIFYFESSSMRGLYECLEIWQNTTQKRIRSLSIQQDHENFCGIVLADSQDAAQTQLKPYDDAMAKFQRKALKQIGVGVNFSTDDINPEKILAIQMKLKKCKTPSEIRAVFLEEYSTDL